MMLSYEGIFFDEEEEKKIFSLEKKNLGIINDRLHCTFKYHPTKEEIFNNLVGEYFDLYLIGYGSDNKNSAFMVTLPEELNEYYINYDTDNKVKVPHITVSLSKGARANDSKDLDFKALNKPIKVRGRFGYFIKDDGKEYASFEPYLDYVKKL